MVPNDVAPNGEAPHGEAPHGVAPSDVASRAVGLSYGADASHPRPVVG